MLSTEDRLAEEATVFCLAAPARINSNLRQEPRRGGPFVFSGLRTSSSPRTSQHPYFSSLPYSLQHKQNITTVFPVTSTLFVRSFACVQVSSPLFSGAHALFAKNTGEGGSLLTFLDVLLEVLLFQCAA
jgi:hypothetical protein